MPSPQKRKRKHLATRKFPRKQTPWSSHRPTPDGAVRRPDGTTHKTSLHQTPKKKKKKKKKKNSTSLMFLLIIMFIKVYYQNTREREREGERERERTNVP